MDLHAQTLPLRAVDGIVEFRVVASGVRHYDLWDPSRRATGSVLADPDHLLPPHEFLPRRFLCQDTGVSTNGLPLRVCLAVLPSSGLQPATAHFHAWGAPVASGWGHTVVASDLHRDPDMDQDGMSTVYEAEQGLNPGVADGSLDPDGDGHSNLQESWAGTLPLDPASVLRVSVQRDGGGVRISWPSVPGKTYTVESAPSAAGLFTPVHVLTASEFTTSHVRTTASPGERVRVKANP